MTASTYKDAFEDYFLTGYWLSPMNLLKNPDYYKDNFNCISLENELKPDSLLDKKGCIEKGDNDIQISFANADATLKFCEENGIPLHGCVFVWYSQTPEWFFKEGFQSNAAYVSAEVMNQRLESFIKNTFEGLKKNYPNLKIDSYEICKELFVNDGGGYRMPDINNSVANFWYKIYGSDEFVFNAYRYAREYAPEGTKLLLCDYNEYMPTKTDDIYELALKLKEENLIDSIGMEACLDISYPSVDAFETALKKFISTGLDIQLTEFGVSSHSRSPLVYESYKTFLDICLKYKDNISAVLLHDIGVCGFESYECPKFTDIINNTKKPSGDANGDEVFNVADVVVLQKWLLSNSDSDFSCWSEADMNKDNKLNVFDLCIMKNQLLGIS